MNQCNKYRTISFVIGRWENDGQLKTRFNNKFDIQLRFRFDLVIVFGHREFL